MVNNEVIKNTLVINMLETKIEKAMRSAKEGEDGYTYHMEVVDQAERMLGLFLENAINSIIGIYDNKIKDIVREMVLQAPALRERREDQALEEDELITLELIEEFLPIYFTNSELTFMEMCVNKGRELIL